MSCIFLHNLLDSGIVVIIALVRYIEIGEALPVPSYILEASDFHRGRHVGLRYQRQKGNGKEGN